MKTSEKENLLTKIRRNMKEKGKFVWVSIILSIIVAAATAMVTNISAFSIYERQVKKELEPILFRVKSIIANNKHTQSVKIIYGGDVFRIVAYLDSIGDISRTEEVMTIHKKGDTVSLNFPQFLITTNLKNQMVPVRKQSVPVREQPVPVHEQSVPVREQPVPVLEQPVPVRIVARQIMSPVRDGMSVEKRELYLSVYLCRDAMRRVSTQLIGHLIF